MDRVGIKVVIDRLQQDPQRGACWTSIHTTSMIHTDKGLFPF